MSSNGAIVTARLMGKRRALAPVRVGVAGAITPATALAVDAATNGTARVSVILHRLKLRRGSAAGADAIPMSEVASTAAAP